MSIVALQQSGIPVVGVDFTSTPRRAKPITVAHGVAERSAFGCRLRIERLAHHVEWASYEAWLTQPGPWIGAFDFPFSISRALVEHLGWPRTWAALVEHCSGFTRTELRETFKAFCDARPVGNKFAHRATDRPAGSSPSMKWVNPPVAWMFLEGAPRLLRAGVTVPGMHVGDPRRTALEGYPGLLARMVTRASYKSDERAKQTPQRQAAREQIVCALQEGAHPLGVQVEMSRALRELLVQDGSADWLDAVLCAVAATWAAHRPGLGLPPNMDPLEGWIVGAPHGVDLGEA